MRNRSRLAREIVTISLFGAFLAALGAALYAFTPDGDEAAFMEQVAISVCADNHAAGQFVECPIGKGAAE